MIDEKLPIFVCKSCGNIVRALAYEDTDVYKCRICKVELFKTKYSLSDDEYNKIFSDMHSSFDFRQMVYEEYVQGNELYNSEMNRKRLDEEQKLFEIWMYGESR